MEEQLYNNDTWIGVLMSNGHLILTCDHVLMKFLIYHKDYLMKTNVMENRPEQIQAIRRMNNWTAVTTHVQPKHYTCLPFYDQLKDKPLDKDHTIAARHSDHGLKIVSVEVQIGEMARHMWLEKRGGLFFEQIDPARPPLADASVQQQMLPPPGVLDPLSTNNI